LYAKKNHRTGGTKENGLIGEMGTGVAGGHDPARGFHFQMGEIRQGALGSAKFMSAKGTVTEGNTNLS